MSTIENQVKKLKINDQFIGNIKVTVSQLHSQIDTFESSINDNNTPDVKNIFMLDVMEWHSELLVNQKRIKDMIDDQAVNDRFWDFAVDDLTKSQGVIKYSPATIEWINSDAYKALSERDVYLWLVDYYYNELANVEKRFMNKTITKADIGLWNGLMVVKARLKIILNIKA
ncbi:MAG: hypothetical protein HAW67_05325 [Endozoicomonadaceae bacterium]|nr:hypothetical protein [Endozoicomonadaceae bacterium]